MWVMLNDAWLSIVADRDDEEFLLVRSRRSGDIERVFGIREDVDKAADYHFRQFIHRDHVAGVMAREVQRIAYPNFKNSVKDDKLHTAFTKVWNVGYMMQVNNGLEGVRRRRAHSIIPSSDMNDLWPPLNCESCGVELDHAFHAPVIGQPPGECETCWEKGLHGNHEEEDFEEEGFQEGRDPEDFSFQDLEDLAEENSKVADLFARRSRT